MSFPKNSKQSTTVGSGWNEQSADPFSVEKFEEMLDCINGQDDPAKCDTVGSTLKAELGEAGYDLWLNWITQSSTSDDLDEVNLRKKWDSFNTGDANVGQMLQFANECGWEGKFFENNAYDFEAITGSAPILGKGILPDDLEVYLGLIAQQFGVNYSAVVACFLGISAFCLGGNKRIKIEHDRTDRAILWTALIGNSGDGKTGIMMETGGRFLNNLHSQWDEEYQNSPEDENGEKPPLKRLLSNSLTLEMLTELHTKNTLGIGIYSDELLMCIDGMDQFSKSRSAVLAKILTLYNGDRFDNPTMMSDRRVANPYVCLMGGIQPSLLDKLLNEQHQQAGLAARFLLAYVEENAEITTKSERDRIGQQKLSLGGSQVIDKILERLVNNRETPHVVHYDDRAGVLMGEFEDLLRRKRKQGTDAEQAAYPKLVTYCHRLALLLHYLQDPEPEKTSINCETVRKVIQLIQFFEQSMKRAYGKLALSAEERKHQKVYEKLKSLGEAQAQKIRDGVKKSVESKDVSKIIEHFVREGIFIMFKKGGKTFYKVAGKSAQHRTLVPSFAA